MKPARHLPGLSFFALCFLATTLLAGPVFGQLLFEDKWLEPTDPSLLIGREVAQDGDRIAVTGTLAGGPGIYDGLHIFEKDPGGIGPWSEVARLLPSDFDLYAQFGGSVALDGDTAAVGAYNDDEMAWEAGAVYIFERDASGSWSQTQKLFASGAATGERFGTELALQGGTLVASTLQGDSLHIFERDGSGAFQEILSVPLSHSVADLALDGDTLAFGIENDQVLIYGRSGGVWTFDQSVQPSSFSRFGIAVDLSGDLLAVGDFDLGDGAAYVYERDASGTFQLIHSIAGQSFINQDFGIEVAIDGDILAVGDRSQIFSGTTRRGITTIYRRNLGGGDNWGQAGLLVASDHSSLFRPLSLEAGRLVSGANRGYIYELGTSDLGLSSDLPACSPTTTLPVTVTATGSEAVDRLAYGLDLGAQQDICVGCGFDPVLTTNIDLAACGPQRVTIEAEDASGTRVAVGGEVVQDGQGPSLSYCEDQRVTLPSGSATIRVFPPTATDNCDRFVRVFCDHPDFYFPLGTTAVSCTVQDRCANVTTCTYNVIVEQEGDPEPPAPGCEAWEFFDEVGLASPPPPWRWDPLGDSPEFAPIVGEDGLEIRALGSSMYHGDDNGMFVYQDVVETDFRIEAAVPSQSSFNTETYSKGGLMVRYGLDSLAPRVMAMLVPNHTNGYSLQFDVRAAQGATATELASTVSAIGVNRLAIEKVGSTFTVSFSTDGGATWIQPLGALSGRATLTPVPGTNPQVGFAVSANSQTHDVAFDFDDFELCYPETEPTDPPPVEGCLDDDYADGDLDDSWQLLSLGDADQVAVAETAGRLELSGDGSTLFSSGTDHGAFYYRPVVGDFRLEVDVDASGMTSGGPYRKQGLMVRTDLDEGAVRFITQLAPYWNNADNSQLQFRYRAVQGGAGNQTWASNRTHAPRQARLAIEREGNTLRTEYSFDGGATWDQPGGGAGGEVTLSLPQTLYVGLNTVSYDVNQAVTGVFDDLSLCSLPSISGRIWWDIDADGVQDDDELPIVGAEMELRDSLFHRIVTVLSDADGRYAFRGLSAEPYIVSTDSFIPNTIKGTPEATYDPDGVDTLDYARIDVALGEQITNADFGYRAWIFDDIDVCEVDSFEDGSLDEDWHVVTLGDSDDLTTSESGGALSLSGDGSSLYAADQDHGAFLFREVRGDFRVEVDVDTAGMVGPGAYKKAGLMIRTGLSSSDVRLIAQSIPYWNNGGDSVFQSRYRATEDGAGDGAWGSNVFGVSRQLRLAIERSGNAVSVSYSADGGLTWLTPAGGAGGTVALNLPNQLLVGLNVVAYDDATSTAIFDNFEVCPLP